MELRHLRYFVAVAEELSFTRGAEKLRIAQPSLTRQIKDLEEEIGAPLFDRSKKKVNLTKQGECLLAGAKRLLGDSAEIIQSVRDVGRQASSIRIGYLPSPFHRLLPASIRAFEHQFPTVAVQLFGMRPADQLRAVAEEKIDIAFVGLWGPTDNPKLQHRVTASYPSVALLPRKHRLGSKSAVKLKDLESMFFIVISDDSYPGYARWLSSTCERIGFSPKILEAVDDEARLIQAVRSGLGVAILPEQIRDVPHGNILIRNLTPPILIDSAVVWKRDNLAPPLLAYLQTLEEADDGRRSTVAPSKE
jgi:DNA-binding transcriptional LysR family regulator